MQVYLPSIQSNFYLAIVCFMTSLLYSAVIYSDYSSISIWLKNPLRTGLLLPTPAMTSKTLSFLPHWPSSYLTSMLRSLSFILELNYSFPIDASKADFFPFLMIEVNSSQLIKLFGSLPVRSILEALAYLSLSLYCSILYRVYWFYVFNISVYYFSVSLTESFNYLSGSYHESVSSLNFKSILSGSSYFNYLISSA